MKEIKSTVSKDEAMRMFHYGYKVYIMYGDYRSKKLIRDDSDIDDAVMDEKMVFVGFEE